jgi:hypothetical protein
MKWNFSDYLHQGFIRRRKYYRLGKLTVLSIFFHGTRDFISDEGLGVTVFSSVS